MSLAGYLKRVVPRNVAGAIKSAFPSRYPYHCPICGLYTDSFITFGDPPRAQAACYGCLALERHRLLGLFVGAHPDRLTGRLLHFAPEASIARLFRSRHIRAITTDLGSDRAQLLSDITRLPFPAGTFDSIYCSHVLEHVVDDGQAMRECARVLRPGAYAVFQVPIRGDETYEDWSIDSPAERTAHFGQHDHVRYFGRDIAARFQAAGFDVTEYSPATLTAGRRHQVVAQGFTEPIWVCRRA